MKDERIQHYTVHCLSAREKYFSGACCVQCRALSCPCSISLAALKYCHHEWDRCKCSLFEYCVFRDKQQATKSVGRPQLASQFGHSCCRPSPSRSTSGVNQASVSLIGLIGAGGESQLFVTCIVTLRSFDCDSSPSPPSPQRATDPGTK